MRQQFHWLRPLLALLLALALLSSCGLGTSATSSIQPAPHTSEIGGTAAPAPLSGAQGVRVFVLPDDSIRPVVQGIREAQRSILLEIYLLTDRQVIRALEEAANRGVDVRVLIETHPFGGLSPINTINALEATGVKVKPANPAFKLTHEKSMVIDETTAYIMTANLTVSAFKFNREYGIIDTDATDVHEIAAIFNADWERHPVMLNAPNLVVSPVNSRSKLIGLITGARQSLHIEAEEIQDTEIEDALIAAVTRGVQVQLITSPPNNTGGDQTQDYNAVGIARLRSGGGEVKLLDHLHVHAKIIVADGRFVFVGSENISTPSLDSNRELGLLISDPAALTRIDSTFETDWAAAH